METMAKEDQDPTAQTAPEPLEEVEAPEVTEVKCEEPELSWFDSATAGDLRNLSLHATGSWVWCWCHRFPFFVCKVWSLEIRRAGLQILRSN